MPEPTDRDEMLRFLGNAIVSAMLARALARKLRRRSMELAADRAKSILDQMYKTARNNDKPN